MAIVVIAEELLERVRRSRGPRAPRGPRQARRVPGGRGRGEAEEFRRAPRAGVRGRARALLRPKLLIALTALVLALGGGWLWLRDSSLVAVKRVAVTGAAGPDGAHIRSALIAAARNMTTLHVRLDQLHSAVSPFPVVKDLKVSTQFPHGMRIRVIEANPVADAVVDGRTIAVAGDGTLLHDVPTSGSLPQIPLRAPPGGARLTEGDALHAVALLAAAPSALLGRVSQVTTVAEHGLVAQLRNGPSLYFGDGGQLHAKWAAVRAVLADAGSAGASYIDVSDPGRPAAGAGTSGSSGDSSGTSGSGSSASGDSSGSGASGASSGSGTTPTGG